MATVQRLNFMVGKIGLEGLEAVERSVKVLSRTKMEREKRRELLKFFRQVDCRQSKNNKKE